MLSEISRAFLADRVNRARDRPGNGAEGSLLDSIKLFVFIRLPSLSRPHVLSG
jgi:hypothetical protein